MGVGDCAQAESYVLSLLAEGKHRAAFEVIPEFGSPGVYAPHFANLAYRLWRDGRAGEAADVLDRALELDPNLASAWLALGMVKLSQGELAEGDVCLEKAISLEGGVASAHYLRGVVAGKSGRDQEAVEHLTRCLALKPDHDPAREALQELLARVRSDDALVRKAKKALARPQQSGDAASGRATLSVCLIVKDEEESLPQCLRSVQAVADQIVVVDTGSTDATAAIARRLGAEVHEFAWCDDFSAARNAAVERAACDWVLIVDADEELPAGSADQLRELLADPIPGQVCQLVTHAPRTRSGFSGPSLVGHPRLFRNGEGIHFEGAVHEQLVDRDGGEIEEAVFTGIPVLHHGYLEPQAAMGERDSRNARLLSARAAAEPSNAAVLFYLGMAQMGCGRMEQAAETLRRTLRLAGKDRAFRAKAAVLLHRALEPLGRDEEAEQVLRTALEDEPEHPELLCALGSELERQGRTEEAAESYRAATRGRFGPTIDYQDFICRDVRPRSRLAAIHLAREQGEAAASEARACLAIRPEATEVRHVLAAALLSMGKYAEARSELHAILGQDPDDARAHNSLGVSLALEGRHEEAATEFKVALALEPEEVDTLCNLAHARHAQGDLACARDTWEEALKERPSHVPAWLGLGKTYLESGAYQAGARCYEMAALHSDQAPDVMAAIADARAVLVELGRCGQEGEILS